MSIITPLLTSMGYYKIEGNCDLNQTQVADLRELVRPDTIKTVMEIGFNAGHSAEVFLSTNPNVHVTSFDLGNHDYTVIAKGYIDHVFPGRHTLILGDSAVTVPRLPDQEFDLIFIDGDHEYPMAKADLENCRRLAHDTTLIILDDTNFTEGWEAPWTVGPSKIWKELVEQKRISEIGHKDYCNQLGMSWGNFTHDLKEQEQSASYVLE